MGATAFPPPRGTTRPAGGCGGIHGVSHLSSVPNDPEGLRAWLAGRSPEELRALALSALQAPDPPAYDGWQRFRNAAIEVPSPPPAPRLLTVKVTLRGTKPPVWRRLVLPSDLSLDRVHTILQRAMGWWDGHLHRFALEDGPRSSYFVTPFDLEEGDEGTLESEVRLDQVLREPGHRLHYSYDFGDGWEHLVVLESSAPLPEPRPAPRCTGGRLACPPEDCGGPHAYQELATWLRARAPEVPPPSPFDSAEDAYAWLGDWDPDDFSVEETDRAVRAEHAVTTQLDQLHPEVRALFDRVQPYGEVADWIAALPTEPPAADDLERGTWHWRVLVGTLGNFAPLTSAGWLKPSVVTALNEALGSPDRFSQGNREQNCHPVRRLRESAQAVGIYRKRRDLLELTTRGLSMTDPVSTWRIVSERMPLGKGAERDASWLALLGLAAGVDRRVVERVVADQLELRGWRMRGGGPVRAGDVIELIRDTVTALCGPVDSYFSTEHPAWVQALAADLVLRGD